MPKSGFVIIGEDNNDFKFSLKNYKSIIEINDQYRPIIKTKI